MRVRNLAIIVGLVSSLAGCGRSEDSAQTGAASEPTSGTESTEATESSAGSDAPNADRGADADHADEGKAGTDLQESAETPTPDSKIRNLGGVSPPAGGGL